MDNIAQVVRVDHYVSNGDQSSETIVFVHGYALVQRGIDVAFHICKTIGQKSFKMCIYGKGKPIIEIVDDF